MRELLVSLSRGYTVFLGYNRFSLSQIVIEAPLKEVRFGLVGDGTIWIQLTTQSDEKYLLQAQKNKEAGLGFFKWNEGVSNWDTIGITRWL